MPATVTGIGKAERVSRTTRPSVEAVQGLECEDKLQPSNQQ